MDVLLQPGHVGTVEIPNRIVMPPMTTRTADPEGYVTEDTIAYYGARAEGGIGLITVEMAAPEKAGRHRHHELSIYDNKFLPGLTRLVDVIHSAGSRASIQLGHGGGHTREDISGERPIAPSAIPHPVFEVTLQTIIPDEMTHERIQQTIIAFAAAAKRAEDAGFDCVEIHAAHGYLISQFLTPYENRRNDMYGGSLANRARFGLAVLRAVKSRISRSAVIFRLSVDDFFPEGMPYTEGKQVAIWAAEAGADALHITAGHYRSLPSAARQIPPMALPEATFLHYAADIRGRVNVPIIAVGRLGDPVLARFAIQSGKADFVALGRALIADPLWLSKVLKGEPPRRCLACNTCVDEMRSGNRLGCVVNSAAGRERHFAEAKIVKGQRIAVVGAGPAGLTYASLMAEGNAVTVFEKAARPGGSFRYVGKAPLFQQVEAREQSFRAFIENYVLACEQKGVKFSYGADVQLSPELLQSFDRIVIATGATYRFYMGTIIRSLLNLGIARLPGIHRMMCNPAFRHWFYHSARVPTGKGFQHLASPNQSLTIIGDALRPGKTKPAIESAFEATLNP